MRRLRASYIIWFVFAAYVVIVTSYLVIAQAKKYSVATIDLKGNIEHTSPRDINSVLSEFISANFWGVKVSAVSDVLKTLPWVNSVRVRKVWPDKLEITLKEKQPLAVWGKSFVTRGGEFFTPAAISTEAEGLPVFIGEEFKSKQMLECYLITVDCLQEHGLKIISLEIMPDSGYRVVLNNGIALVLGKNDLQRRVKRFVLAYKAKLHKKAKKIAYVDLRYTNGIAVGWK